MGNPYVKLLSLVDPNQASVEFHNARGGTPKQNITYNAANSSSSSPDSTSVTLSNEVAETLDKIGKYFPAMLGVMAFNALILLILVVVGIFFICKGRSKKPRIPRGRKSPMPRRRASDVESLRPPQPHAYQPVSMALTEETMFTPPSPGFHKFGSDGPRKSAIYRGSVAMGEDTPFVPPSPVRNSTVYRNSMVVPEDTPFTPPSPIQSEGPKSFVQVPEDDVLVPPSPSYHSFDGAVVRSGDRPSSVISQNLSIAPADETIFMPPRAIQSGNLRPGSRPQSVASQRSQHIGVALTDEPVFAPPPRTLPAFQNNNLRPGDRPQSFASPPATAPPSQDYMLSPPSPGFHSFDRSGDRPRSVA
jgi:saccharopepsin